MWKLRSVLVALLLCTAAVSAVDQRSKWQTLAGDAPLVIARGGFSGLFADSSYSAFSFAIPTSLTNVILWCDVQLTKDSVGICFPDLLLNNASDIKTLFPSKQNKYDVNGVSMSGWFPLDFTFKDLALVSLTQGIYSRTYRFDGTPEQILEVETVGKEIRPPGLWLNIQHDVFYRQHNLSMRSFVISASKSFVVNYISSPEVAFLQSIVARFRRGPTKLVFRFLGPGVNEPSTNQTYGSLLKNLMFIKSFAYGILVPKSYIWPLDSDQYLLHYTSVVLDAHKAGLAVFASDFLNDAPIAYDFSYDPVVEYLKFIDNGDFSVDGVLSDFPITPSNAIDCYSHMGKNEKETAKLLVISSEGASGDFPGCTDLAYTNAILAGVDVLDCPVQLTNDGIPFCLGSVNLIDRTNVAQTEFGSRLTSIPELNVVDGIYTFNLSWSNITDGLKPAIANPRADFKLYRNPKFRDQGKFVSLSDFLDIAKNASSVSGVLIIIENAVYLAEKQGQDVTDAVQYALSKAGYNETVKKVMIQSTDSSVLEKFKNTKYELVYAVDKAIRDITNSTILDIKSFASSVVISKSSVFPTDDAFLTGQTNVVPKLQAFGLSVYAQLFSNEFVTQAWDYFSDPYVEINNFAQLGGINGVVTDFPATANKYRRNRCLSYKEVPSYMLPVRPGGLLQVMAPSAMPPAIPPNPVLVEKDVAEPPLPAVVKRSPPGSEPTIAPSVAGPPRPSGQGSEIASSISLGSLAILLVSWILS